MEINDRKINNIIEEKKNKIYKENFYEFFSNVAFPSIFPNKQLLPSKSTRILCKIAEATSKKSSAVEK